MNAFLLPALAGLLTGAALIIAIGPQNVFVLRQGVLRAHVTPVVVVCALSDVVLIVAGVAGLGALVSAHPTAITVAKILGGLYVIALGLMAAKRAMRSGAALVPTDAQASVPSRWVAIGTALALTWLNPHVYLDTVITMGAIANSHGAGKWAFAVGAAVASIVWFALLGGGGHRLAPLFAKPRAWRILDAVVAIIMIVMGGALLFSA